MNNVVVLEANDRIGGRINSVPINDYWIEFGAQWIHGQGENPLWKFAVEKKVLSTLLGHKLHSESNFSIIQVIANWDI